MTSPSVEKQDVSSESSILLSQLKRGSLVMCVLFVLSKHDRYGYELIEKISKHIQITEGTIYPILHRIQKEGYCVTYLKESAQGPSRKYYQITAEGKAALKSMRKVWNGFIIEVEKLMQEVQDL